MSHFLLGVPVEMPSLTLSLRSIVAPVRKPTPGFRFITRPIRSLDDLVHRDIEKAVEAFMSIKTYEDALAVFSVYGALSGPPVKGPNIATFAKVQNLVRAAWRVRTAGLKEIMEWHEQDWYRYADAALPAEFVDVWPGLMSLTVSPATLWISLDDPPGLEFAPPANILEAVIDVLHLEKLQGVRHKYCALPDCRKPFEVRGDKERKFCSYECSHKSAVRASRQRAKKTDAKGSSKRSTRR